MSETSELQYVFVTEKQQLTVGPKFTSDMGTCQMILLLAETGQYFTAMLITPKQGTPYSIDHEPVGSDYALAVRQWCDLVLEQVLELEARGSINPPLDLVASL